MKVLTLLELCEKIALPTLLSGSKVGEAFRYLNLCKITK